MVNGENFSSIWYNPLLYHYHHPPPPPPPTHQKNLFLKTKAPRIIQTFWLDQNEFNPPGPNYKCYWSIYTQSKEIKIDQSETRNINTPGCVTAKQLRPSRIWQRKTPQRGCARPKKRRCGAVVHEIKREQRPESQAYLSLNTENANTSWVILSEG